MSEVKIEDKKCISPKFRVSFPNLAKAKAFGDGGPKYGLTMLYQDAVPAKKIKAADISVLMNAIQVAAEERWGSKANAVIEKLKKSPKGWPFRNGNREKPDFESHKDMIFVATNRKEEKGAPQTVGPDRKEINPASIYAGCYARAELLAYAYDNEFGKGLGFSLLNVQKIGDGAKFTGQKDAKDVFDAVEEESDDPESYSNGDEEADESEDDESQDW